MDISDVVANIQLRLLKAEVNTSHASDSGGASALKPASLLEIPCRALVGDTTRNEEGPVDLTT